MYRFQNGVVTAFHYHSAKITMQGGMIVQQKSSSELDDAFRFRLNDSVVVAWKGSDAPRQFRGVRYVDREAVEPVYAWQRPYIYKRNSPRNEQKAGFRAEHAAFHAFLENGVRAELATDYEDEQLHVDLWVFLKPLYLPWSWLPLDLTLRSDMDPYENGSKYDRAFRKNVIAARIENFQTLSPAHLYEKMCTAIDAGLKDMDLCGRKPITRQEAKEEELAYNKDNG